MDVWGAGLNCSWWNHECLLPVANALENQAILDMGLEIKSSQWWSYCDDSIFWINLSMLQVPGLRLVW